MDRSALKGSFDSQKRQKLKEVLPILWTSYEHIHNAREVRTNNSINFFSVPDKKLIKE